MLGSRYSIGANRIITMDGAPLEGYFINVHDNRIESLTKQPAFTDAYDFGTECTILPGVVNMHTHLELSGIEGPLDLPIVEGHRSMAEWIARLMEFRRSNCYNAKQGVERALLRQDVLTETVAIADITAPDEFGETRPISALPRRFRFVECIAWNDRLAAEVLAKMDALSSNSYEGFSPHAPQTVCPVLLESIIERAKRKYLPVAMHLAETPEEIQLLERHDGPLLDLMRRADPEYDPGKTLLRSPVGSSVLGRPMDYLRMLAETPHGIVVHGSYLDDKELRYMAAHRETMSVVYCPRSHAYFGHAKYPLKKMIDMGINVFFGTDSLASSPDLSIVREMQFAASQHPNVAMERIVQAGTLGPAQKLGLDADFGSIRPGKRACFAVSGSL